MVDITRERAREIISEIYHQSGGFLGDNEREGALATVLGKPVLEAAKRAWTTDTRFIYELIQNADDASYHCAISEFQPPTLKFRFYSDRIVVESNEDGFDETDVRAICSAGRRTKTGKIGEKGIGFKSVFRIASKVIIQSGPFCFSLQHRDGQNGLGMIAPVNEAHEELEVTKAFTVRTQITLFPLQPELNSNISSMVEKFPPSTFAFLSNVKTVTFSGPGVLPWIGTSFARYLLKITRIFNYSKSEELEWKDQEFFYFKRQVSGLPARESRPLSKQVDIILAFPLDRQHQLNIRPFAHAYLPLRDVGLGFLVQSDFVTLDNREELAICPWNDHLLSNLPQMFYDALETLCRDSRFSDSWIRFISFKELQNPYWSQFRDSVLKNLRHVRLFRTREGTLKSLDEVRYFLPEHCRIDGYPLFSGIDEFDDTEEDIYLSSEYAEFYDILKPFGLQAASSRQLLDRFRTYLDGPNPKLLRKKNYDHDWYDRMALLLLSWLNSPLDSIAKEIKQLPLVPVRGIITTRDGSVLHTSEVLKSPSNLDIYFRVDSTGKMIPDSLLYLTSGLFERNEPTKELFSCLGVKHAEPSFILEKICNLNESIFLTPPLFRSIRNIQYVFSVRPDWRLVDPRCILLYDSDEEVIKKPHWESNKEMSKGEMNSETDDIYFKNEVLREAGIAIVASGHPPLQIRFLHPGYYDPPFCTDNTSWMQWLEKVGPIRQAPRLEAQGSPSQPSDILISIINHAPRFLIRILQSYWRIYEEELKNVSTSTLSTIRGAVVPVECGTAALERSFLGTSEQRAIWSGIYLKGKFPFLSISTKWESADGPGWKFLDRFGVTTTITTEFLVASARELSRVFPRRHAKDAFFKLYEMLTVDSFKEFCARMSDTGFIYIPQSGTDDRLVQPSDCLWHGDVSGTKHVLACHDAYKWNHEVEELFETVLDSEGEQWVTKLSHFKMETWVFCSDVYPVYKAIMEGPKGDGSWIPIREEFENKKYIYIPHKWIWCPPSCCVWSACPYIDGRYGIRHDYPDLEYFFVQGLCIPQPEIPAYIEKILDMAKVGNINLSELLLVMQELNDIHPTPDDLERLESATFLPMRHKNKPVIYVTPAEAFFIIDDARIQLDPEVPVLDIMPEEACRLRPLFIALGLVTRYVSTQIHETTCNTIDDAVESAELTHDFRQRAEALCRCSIYYGGVKAVLPDSKIRKLFSRATVFTAKCFRRHFLLDHGLATEESHEGRLHAEEVNDSLQFYVPSDEKQRAICYATELPNALVEYFQIDHPAACGTFATILRESPDILDQILAEKGIICPPIGLLDELPIRTKSELAPEDIGTNFSPSLASTQILHKSGSIKLIASKEYRQEQNNSLPYSTSLTKKYDVKDLDPMKDDSLGIISEYFRVNHEDRNLSLTEAALRVAAESVESVHMQLLLDDLDTRGEAIIITEFVLISAVENELCGHKIMCLLRDSSESCGQNLAITDAVLEAAAENEAFGPQIMADLLQYLTDQEESISIPDTALKAAVENTEFGDSLVALLLPHRGQSRCSTDDILIAAAKNEDLGYQIIFLLLDDAPGDIGLSQATFQAATENLHQGAKIMALLLAKNPGCFYVTEEILISAAYNSVSGLEILTLLGNFSDGELEVTERVMLAVAETGDCMEIIDLFLDLHKGILPITSAVLETAVRNPACTRTQLIRLQALRHHHMRITEGRLDTAVHIPREFASLLRHQGRITECDILAAVAGKDDEAVIWFKTLLQEPHEPITDAIFETAIQNPIHGPEFVAKLLPWYPENLHISENSLLIAARNPVSGPEILDLLLKERPDLQITDDVILAAAGTSSSAAEQLIRYINDLPIRPPLRITEVLLETIAGNRICGARVFRLLLDIRGDDESLVPVTETALVNAAGNIQCGYEIMTLLLDYGDEDLENLITENVSIKAAGNPMWGVEILTLLLDRDYTVFFSMDVFATAERNIWCGEEVIAFLLKNWVSDTEHVESSQDEDGDEDFTEGADMRDDDSDSYGSIELSGLESSFCNPLNEGLNQDFAEEADMSEADSNSVDIRAAERERIIRVVFGESDA